MPYKNLQQLELRRNHLTMHTVSRMTAFCTRFLSQLDCESSLRCWLKLFSIKSCTCTTIRRLNILSMYLYPFQSSGGSHCGEWRYQPNRTQLLTGFHAYWTGLWLPQESVEPFQELIKVGIDNNVQQNLQSHISGQVNVTE